MTLTIAEGVAQLENLCLMLNDERNRLVHEADMLDDVLAQRGVTCTVLPFLCSIDVGEYATRRDTLLVMATVIDDFVSKLPDFVAIAEAGDVDRLNSLTRAAAKMLAAVSETSAVDDLLDDVAIFVRDVARDAVKAVTPPSSFFGGLGLGLAAIVGVLVATR